MSVKLLTEHHMEFISLKEAAQARLSLHLSKWHIVGNHISLLYYGGVLFFSFCHCFVKLFNLDFGPLAFSMPGFVSIVSPTWKLEYV